MLTVFIGSKFVDVTSIIKDLTACGIIKSHKKLDKCSFTSTVISNECNLFSLLDFKIETFERLFLSLCKGIYEFKILYRQRFKCRNLCFFAIDLGLVFNKLLYLLNVKAMFVKFIEIVSNIVNRPIKFEACRNTRGKATERERRINDITNDQIARNARRRKHISKHS